MFYNPTTGSTRILEHADFDERYFPCLTGSKHNNVLSFALSLPPPASSSSSTPSESYLTPPEVEGLPPLSDERSDVIQSTTHLQEPEQPQPLPSPSVEPANTPETPKAASSAPTHDVSPSSDQDDSDTIYGTPISPEPPKTPPHSARPTPQPSTPPRHTGCTPAPRRAY
ncbi:hypothetical protein NP233_g8680 [Leucocoprinus birnbaumii]|uniref:Uncharacterized protein n=1 Tax=Leucocoprinus birnbaumii TaxID=56174 RepID=A0AAD5VMG5_9AGAR|nr:hypothetical protein NP233_g8680 [Leucocoprinus birnbaumii]